jgi:N-glycosylase/DNA lyase
LCGTCKAERYWCCTCTTTGESTFPSAEKIASAGIEALAPLRAGFRAKYIIDAAEKVSSGEVDLKKIAASPLDEGRDELIKIKGVGEKVAQCALLYGFGKIDAFPVDVWVKRIMAELYPDGLPECTNGVRGIAQQYLFHWYRINSK